MADRYFHLFRAGMGRFPAVDVSLRLDTLIEALKFYYDKEDTFSFITSPGQDKDERNGIIISDFKDEGSFISILLVRGDPGRTMPGFVNLKARTVTTIKSEEPGSVRGSSCHIVISKQEIAKGADSGTYRMVIEQAPGIGRVLARDFLGSLLARFSQDHPHRFVAEKKRKLKGQKPETIDYRPTVRFHPHQNANLREDLIGGRIGGFKLVHGSTEFTGEASAPRIEKLDVQLHARIVPTNDFLGVKSLVEGLRGALPNIDFDRLKLELVDEGGEPIQTPRALKLDDVEDADMRYCKKIKMNSVDGATDECYASLHIEIVSCAERIISSNAQWD